jgi:hypothetical protein
MVPEAQGYGKMNIPRWKLTLFAVLTVLRAMASIIYRPAVFWKSTAATIEYLRESHRLFVHYMLVWEMPASENPEDMQVWESKLATGPLAGEYRRIQRMRTRCIRLWMLT